MLFDDSYHTIEAVATGELRDRGSRFHGFAYPITQEQQVKEIIQQLKKEHPQANHHCYAFRLTPDPTVFRASDDREPSGSAGKPILGAIQSAGLTDILIVVVRYFGGTLLGVPGLIQAYRGAAQSAIANAKVVEKYIFDTFQISFPYDCTGDVHTFLKIEQAKILQQEYAEPCTINFAVRRSRTNQLLDKLKNHPLLGYQSEIKALS